MSEFVMFPLMPTGETPGALNTNPNPHSGGWQQIGSFGYADFAASATHEAIMAAPLNSGATQRSFVVANSLNEALTDVVFWLFASAYSALNNAGGGQSYADSGGIASQGYGQYTSEAAGILAFHGDSVMIALTMGATAPTSGSVDVYVQEFYS